jgi:hypothetical protein
MKVKFVVQRQGEKVYEYSESFGVCDAKGREVGSSISIYKYEIVEVDPQNASSYTVLEVPEGGEMPTVGGSYIRAYNQQTRDGKSFGGGRSSVCGVNIESVKKEVHDKFESAKKYSEKKYAKNN